MIGSVQTLGEVGLDGADAECPRARDDQLDVDTLLVHVGQAALDVAVAHVGRGTLAPEQLGLALQRALSRRARPRRAPGPTSATPARRCTGTRRGWSDPAACCRSGTARIRPASTQRVVGVLVEHFHRRVDVGVDVNHAHPATPFGVEPLCV